MAFYVGIKKIREISDKEALYTVKTYDNVFLIKINLELKTIEIIKNDSIESYIIDFNDPGKKINIEWLSGKIIYAIVVKSKTVIAAQTFFENISFCS